MVVAAQDALDLPVPDDHRRQGFGVAKVDRVHARHAAQDRRMVQHQHGAALRSHRQRGVQPGETLGAKLPMARPWNDAVQHDQAHRQVVHDVLHELRIRDDARIGRQTGAEQRAPIVVAGH